MGTPIRNLVELAYTLTQVSERVVRVLERESPSSSVRACRGIEAAVRELDAAAVRQRELIERRTRKAWE